MSPTLKHCLGVVGLVFLLAALLTVAGWRERWAGIDFVPDTLAALDLLERGQVPPAGCLSSYRTYNPPGNAWLLAPGVALFSDPRVQQLPGSLLLLLGTLLGVYALTARLAGRGAASWAVLVYGLSLIGLYYAATLWPRGRPCFVVWTAYFLVRWVGEDRGRWLAAAVFTWGLGMYVFMETAPLVLVFPALWLIYRPRLSWGPLAAAVLALALVWSPYLTFVAHRGGQDLKVFMLRGAGPGLPDAPTLRLEGAPWCDPDLEMRKIATPEAPPAGTAAEAPPAAGGAKALAVAALTRGLKRLAVIRGVLVFFDRGLWAGAWPAWAGMALMVWLALGQFTGAHGRRLGGWLSAWAAARWPGWLGWGFLALALVANQWLLGWLLSPRGELSAAPRLAVQGFQAVLVLLALVLLWRRLLATLGGRWIALWSAGPCPVEPRALIWMLALPWGALLFLAEHPGASHRLTWLWPLVVPLMAVAWRRLPWPWARLVVATALALGLVANATVLRQADRLASSAPWGQDTPLAQVLARVARTPEAAATGRVALGYGWPTPHWLLDLATRDAHYRVGADADLFLRLQWGVDNIGQCAEGFAAGDRYRILREPDPDRDRGLYLPAADLAAGFAPLDQAGEYRLVERAP